MKDLNTKSVKSAVRTANKVATETANVAAGVGAAMADIKAESVSGLAESLSALTAGLAAMREDAERREKAHAETTAALLAKLTAPKVRTVKVAADGTQVVSSGKRGKPPTAGLDDCREEDGKVRKVGLRAYSHECSGDRLGTYRLATRGALPKGVETISKSAACPYTAKQLDGIEAASSLLPYGLRFTLVSVTDATVKMVPARLLTEQEAAGPVAAVLSSFGLDIDAWTRLRTTTDGTGEGEINAPEVDGDDGLPTV